LSRTDVKPAFGRLEELVPVEADRWGGDSIPIYQLCIGTFFPGVVSRAASRQRPAAAGDARPDIGTNDAGVWPVNW